MGAIAGPIPPTETVLLLGREILSSGEVDALIFHGIGGPGMHGESDPQKLMAHLEFEKSFVTAFQKLEQETEKPVLIGTHYSQWESQAVSDLNTAGIRTYNDILDIVHILSSMHKFGQHHPTRT